MSVEDIAAALMATAKLVTMAAPASRRIVAVMARSAVRNSWTSPASSSARHFEAGRDKDRPD